MPAALSELCGYAQKCVNLLLPLMPRTSDEQRVTGQLAEIPPIPHEALFALGESIEFGEDRVAEAIADLIRKIQIQHARVVSVRQRLALDQLVMRTNITDYIVDAVEVFARASKLFPYARRETDEPPDELIGNDMRTAAHACDIWEENADIFARVRTRYDD